MGGGDGGGVDYPGDRLWFVDNQLPGPHSPAIQLDNAFGFYVKFLVSSCFSAMFLSLKKLQLSKHF
jgi:hypothetical protein